MSPSPRARFASLLFSPLLLLLLVLPLVVGAAPLAAARVAFISSLYGPGDLGGWAQAGAAAGVAAGDAVCRALAADAGLANADTFRAWLSDDTADAWCHLQGLTGTRASACDGASLADPAQGPWVGIDGRPFAGRLLELADPAAPRLYGPLAYDETGTATDLWGAETWTGTTPSGTLAEATCADWSADVPEASGAVGDALEAGPSWSAAGAATCNSHKRLYCFEPGAGESPHAPPVGESVTAFLSSATGSGDLASWAAAGSLTGVAAADAVCQALAAAAGLPAADSFLAWLSDTATGAAGHVGALPAIRRVDGFPVALSLALLLAQPATALESALAVTESCAYGGGGGEVWTGTTRFGAADDLRCLDWSSAANESTGRHGRSVVARSWHWTDAESTSCDSARPLYCFSTTPYLFWDRFECGSTIRWAAQAP